MTIGPYGTAGGDRAQLRVSSHDRDRAIELLQGAFSYGRLTKEEYDLRAGQALNAQTYADLDTLVADLPAAGPPYPGPVPQPGAWAYPGAVTRTNPLAITSMVCGIVQFFGFWLLAAIPAVVCGHIARRQIRQTGEQGAGMALAGLIMGWAGVALTAIFVVVIIIVIVVANGQPATGG
jgi:Domain of unknown function (DUF4190)/Domain of unknown function (DUF1707)